jgi:hypothetical protein
LAFGFWLLAFGFAALTRVDPLEGRCPSRPPQRIY